MDNISVLPDRQAVKEAAAAWIVKMDGQELTAEDQQALIEWIEANPLHRETLVAQAELWQEMGVLSIISELVPAPIHHPPENTSSTHGWWRAPSFAAAFLVMLSISVVLTWQLVLPHDQVLQTAVGEVAEFELEDGSIVTLNTDTQLKIEYSKTRRAVTLVKGEANFKVVKKADSPFVVFAGSGIVWAVGTEFVVRDLGERVGVTVTEGRVKIFSETEPNKLDLPSEQHSNPSNVEDSQALALGTEALLEAGESLTFDQVILETERLPTSSLSKRLAWKNQSLIFTGETLSYAVQEISRYTERDIVVIDDALLDLEIGGHFRTDNIDDLLAGLGENWDIAVEVTDDNRILLSSLD